MGKVKLPDDINDWDKKSLREDIGSSSEHKHTIYVYKDFAIEHEEECNHWNPYVIVNGHPLKLHEGYFHNFDEALGYMKGAIKEKELVDFDNSPDEPEFPKAETEDMHKGVQLPTAREMFAEAHCLPDADTLRQSYKEHRSQMYDMLFNARKAEDESEGEGADGKKNNVQTKMDWFGIGGGVTPGSRVDERRGISTKQFEHGDDGNGVTFREGLVPNFSTNYTGKPGPAVQTEAVETSSGTVNVPKPTGVPTSGHVRTGPKGTKTPEALAAEVNNPTSQGGPEDKKRISRNDRTSGASGRKINPEGNVARKIRRKRVDSVANILDKEESKSREGAKQDIREIRAKEIAEGGKPITPMPQFKGLISVGTFNHGNEELPMISAGSNYGRKFFSNAPGEGGKRKGIYSALDAHNAMVDAMNPNDDRIVQGMIHKYTDDLGDLSAAQVRNLFVNNYRVKDPTTGAFTARPKYSEQVDYLGGIDLTKDIFNPDGSLNGLAWSAIQRGDAGPEQPDWTLLNYTDVSGDSFNNPQPYLHISGDGGWSPHDNVFTDYRLARDKFNEVRNNPSEVRRLLNSGMSLKQLNELKKEVSPRELNRMMGYNFYSTEPTTEQTDVNVEDKTVSPDQQFSADYTPEGYGENKGTGTTSDKPMTEAEAMDARLKKEEEKQKKQAKADAKLKEKVIGWQKVMEDAEDGLIDIDDPVFQEASAGLQEVYRNYRFIVNNYDLFDENLVREATEALSSGYHDMQDEQDIRNVRENMSQDEQMDFVENDIGEDDYKEVSGVSSAKRKNAVKQRARLISKKRKDWGKDQMLDDQAASGELYNKYTSMRGENMDDVMKAKVKQDGKQKGLGDFKDTPESERKERAPLKPKEGPKVADIGSFEDDPNAEAPEPELRRRQSELDVGFAKETPQGLDSENTWSDNPTAPTAQVKLDQVEDRVVPQAPSPQMSLDAGWTSTAPGYDPVKKIKEFGVQLFGSMQMDDWIKALRMTRPGTPEYDAMARAIQYRVDRDPSFSPMERNIYGTHMKNALVNKGPLVKSFREEMEKSISDKDAAAGVPMGFMGTHPMICPYNRVDIGYDKDATYPFELRNALTGKKICDVADTPRENSN